MAPSSKGDVTVCVRMRPCPSSEEICASTTREYPGTVFLSGDRIESLSEVAYQYDHAFGPNATQEEVYTQAVAPICHAVIQGYNGAVIAYGQTGSGKTHTMVGNGRCKGIAGRGRSDAFCGVVQAPLLGC
jgi:hypothetical protein